MFIGLTGACQPFCQYLDLSVADSGSEAMSIDGDCAASHLLCSVASTSPSLAMKSTYRSGVLSWKRQGTFCQDFSSGTAGFSKGWLGLT